jgi:hypothetical protein
LAAGRLYQAEKHFDGGAFAGAIGTQEAEDFTATDLEREATDGDLRAELFAKADGFDGQVVGRQKILREGCYCDRKTVKGILTC